MPILGLVVDIIEYRYIYRLVEFRGASLIVLELGLSLPLVLIKYITSRAIY